MVKTDTEGESTMPSKQEKILEGIGKRLCGYGDRVCIENCDACVYFVEATNNCKKRDEFISYLHSQDIVW